MKLQAKKIKYRRIALILSLVALAVWALLGTGASLAWFADTSPTVTNIFHFADFDVEVSYLTEDGKWEKLDGQTKIFDDEALYEPGYVQVVYLEVKNNGDREFEFHTAVSVTGYTPGTNVFGQSFNLQDYLKFGVVTYQTEEEMLSHISDRDDAVEIATEDLNNYYHNNYTTDAKGLNAGDTAYLALIVRMPEEVNNIANYRNDVVPKVELGVIVKADQIKN